MTYDAHQTSVQDGAPVELYTFVGPTGTVRLTDAEEDVTFGSLFSAAAIRRANVETVSLGNAREVVVSLDLSHSLAQQLLGNGVPPRNVELTITQYHRGDAGSRQIHRGFVAAVEVSGTVLRMLVPSSTDNQVSVHLPMAIVQRNCNHLLYDAGCTIERDYPDFDNYEFMSACEVDTVSGVTITVVALVDESDVARPDQWAQFGEVRDPISGERRSVVSQEGTTLTIDIPFPSLSSGADLEVYAGCDHSAETCSEKFDNIHNFGGMNEVPRTHPFAPVNYQIQVKGQ